MTKKNSFDSELSKPTFEACLASQEELRHLLNRLIEQGRPLNPGEREKYFILLPLATLGEGVRIRFNVCIDRKMYSVSNVEAAGRWLGDQTDPQAWVPGEFGYADSPLISIAFFWKALRDHLYNVFPIALSKALSMSKEDTKSKQTEGYRVN